MAHWPAELLDDLTDLLDEVRCWTGVIEKKPGVFYVRREPFLHFHLVEVDPKNTTYEADTLRARP